MPPLERIKNPGEAWSTRPEADEGGSQPIEVLRIPLAFDTPDLVLTGIEVYTPTVGDVIAGGTGILTFISTAWNGATPAMHFGTPLNQDAYDVDSSIIGSVDLTAADVTHEALAASQVTDSPNGSGLIFVATTPLVVMVDDFAGGNPGSTAGACELILTILKAS